MLRKADGWADRYWRALLRIGDERIAALVVTVLCLSVIYKYAIGATKFAANTEGPIAYGCVLLIIASTVALAIWQWNARYSELWRPLHILMRGTALVIFAQVAIDALHPAAWLSNVFIGAEPSLRLLIGIAFLSGILALRRPSFIVPMGAAYVAFRYHAPVPFGLMRTSLDFQTLNDISTFSAGIVLAWRIMSGFRRLLPRPIALAIAEPGSWLTFQKLAWAICVGVHIGNYFHSALAKVHVGGPQPWFWLINNPTAQSIAIGLHRMNNPLAGWPTLLDGYYDILTFFVLPLNIFVFFIQFFSPLAILNRRVLILFTLAFDVMHLAIYFSLGAFFFLWIALNIVILLSLKAMRDSELTPAVKITAILCAILGYLSFYQAGLGWLDGKKVVRPMVYAQLENGRSVLVPPATFGLYAYQMAHGDLYIPDNHFQLRAGGNATISDWDDASTCGPVIVERQTFVRSLDEIEAMVRAADSFYRRHPWIKEFGLYYLYPHHSPSNPAFFKGYDEIEMADIRGYTYVVESSCIGVRDGRLDNDVRVRSEFEFGV